MHALNFFKTFERTRVVLYRDNLPYLLAKLMIYLLLLVCLRRMFLSEMIKLDYHYDIITISLQRAISYDLPLLFICYML